MDTITMRILSLNDANEIIPFAQKLNPAKTSEELLGFLTEMFSFGNYHCFGLYAGDVLAGITSGWVTVRFYSGKQLEVDNVIVDPGIRSKGLGKTFLGLIEEWAIANGCKTIELNTYVQNGRSHKFYFNLGYNILGFHFQKIVSGNP